MQNFYLSSVAFLLLLETWIWIPLLLLPLRLSSGHLGSIHCVWSTDDEGLIIMMLISIRSCKLICQFYVCICKNKFKKKSSCEKMTLKRSSPPSQSSGYNCVITADSCLQSEGLLNTLMIRLQNELLFSLSIPRLTPSLREPHK